MQGVERLSIVSKVLFDSKVIILDCHILVGA